MNYPPINKEGLLAALAQIEAVPEGRNQRDWHCDTAHCIDGLGQIMAGKKPDDATARRDARQFFGLTYHEANRLFCADDDLDEIREIIAELTAEGYGDSYDRDSIDSHVYDRDGYDFDGLDSMNRTREESQ